MDFVGARARCHSSPAREIHCIISAASGPIRVPPVHVLGGWACQSREASLVLSV